MNSFKSLNEFISTRFQLGESTVSKLRSYFQEMLKLDPNANYKIFHDDDDEQKYRGSCILTTRMKVKLMIK